MYWPNILMMYLKYMGHKRSTLCTHLFLKITLSRILFKWKCLTTKCCKIKSLGSALSCPMSRSGLFPFCLSFLGNYIWAWVCPRLVFSSCLFLLVVVELG